VSEWQWAPSDLVDWLEHPCRGTLASLVVVQEIGVRPSEKWLRVGQVQQVGHCQGLGMGRQGLDDGAHGVLLKLKAPLSALQQRGKG
jgi:hypothetical protein